jgi:hypothetical protein
MSRAPVSTSGVLALFALGLACTSQPVVLPSRDFNRPTDIAFVCMGGVTEAATATASVVDGGDAGSEREAGTTGGIVLTGQPMRVCHPRGANDLAPGLSRRTFGFVPNSASGELAVIDADNWKLVNLDPANFGYNQLPLGVLPSQIVASDDGCRVVTANHGSCDLSLVDPAALLAPTFARAYPTVSSAAANPVVSTTVVPKTSAGVPLRVLPGEIAFLPRGTTQLPAQVCDSAWTWQALVTFPSCDLVALLDMPSGEIKKAAYVRSTGTGANRSVVLEPLADGEAPVCPITDCPAVGAPADASADASSDASSGATNDGGATAEAGANDGGANEAGTSETGVADAGADGGASAPDATTAAEAGAPSTATLPPLGVGPLAIVPESGRAYVGLANASFVVAFDVAPNTLSPAAGGGVIPLENAIGVNRLRLSIDPYLDKTTGTGSTGISGSFIGNTADPAREYLYVVARDGTLRVVQVAQAPESECETNFDPSTIPADNPDLLKSTMANACLPIDDLHRRPSAIGPGIRPPTPPIDVAVADISPMPADQSETSVSGVHAWMITASGNVYLINIAPVPRNIAYVEGDLLNPCTAPPSGCVSETDVFGYPPPPNVLRNRNVLSYTLALDPSEGLPRLDVPSSEASVGPRIESVWTQGSRDNEIALSTSYLQTEVFFPDLTSVTPQTWTVTWQGPLMANPSFSGELQQGATTLRDFGQDFCRLGAQPTDLVTLNGCANNNQCGTGKTCVVGTEGTEGAGGLSISGLCLAPGTATATCESLLSTVRRYDVTSVSLNTLDIAPHKDELLRPSLKPCVPNGTSAAADGGVDARTGAGGADGGEDAKAPVGDGGGADTLLSRVTESDCVDPTDPSTVAFQCLEGVDGVKGTRCLVPCHTADSTQGCRAGRICVVFGPANKPAPGAAPGKAPDACDTHECFCADGPDLTQPSAHANECLGELFPYQVNTGRSFLVVGSQTGIPVTQTSVTKNGVSTCGPITSPTDPRDVARISMDAPHCIGIDDDTFDTSCDPNGGGTCPNLLALENKDKALGDPNPCLLVGGPNVTDPATLAPEHIRALFRNRELQFMMTNLEQPPSNVFQIRFDVHGGFQPQLVTIPSTVEVTMPARIVLGPFDSNQQTTGTTTDLAEIPYLFVVDQRELGRSQGGGPARGQLLRINPRGYAITTPAVGAQPWFEDLTHSTNLFPIQ